MDDLILRLVDGGTMTLTIIDDADDMQLQLDNIGGEIPAYEGPTVFTPSRETQIAPTKNKLLLDNITINPIPQNYGLVTYNGSIITIS